ncbi:MAG: DUF3365 domain-containing protein [Planctomycetes bacterium]|nr:DUF3365 domain-containing protein [Planctomycetota bacterium]
MKPTARQRTLWIAALSLMVLGGGLLASLVTAGPGALPEPPPVKMDYAQKQGDEELAYLLVKLELRTRAVIAGHYGRSQSSVPGVNQLYKRSLAKNLVLPAAVADSVFSEVVPRATGGRAWVKMVVDEPRNPNNRGDETALEVLGIIKQGAAFAEQTTAEAYYYGEPIKATAKCLRCHGDPKGAPDPSFPQYQKDGWHDGDIVGAVIARVAPPAQ